MSVREAKIADVAEMARVRVDTWKAAYRGIVPDDYLDALSYEKTETNWRKFLFEEKSSSFSFVAETPEGEIVGVAIAGPVRPAEDEFKGEIYVLYVLPQLQHQGYGRALMNACAQRLCDFQLTPILLWTLEQNPARKFYEKLHGIVVREKQEETGGIYLTEVAYGWRDAGLLCNRMTP